MTRPRAADDFTTIQERVKELRREASETNAAASPRPGRAEAPLTNHERRHEERREGHPPPWVPTIFLASLDSKATSRQMPRGREDLHTSHGFPA